jgi:type II secretory ATPase GspE/PulE/Tfp pilus assembly ATPase PilB-like protein
MGTDQVQGLPQTGIHITNFKNVPSYSALLTHGLDAVTSVASDKINNLVALRLKDGSAFLLCIPSEQSKVAWYALLERLKSKGFALRGYATCTPEVMRMILFDINRMSKADARQVAQDAEVVSNLVNNSAPIGWFKDLLASVMLIGASDIHLEYRGPRTVVRVRLDGLMREYTAVPRQIAADGVSAIFNIIAEENSRSEGAFNESLAQQAMIPLNLGSELVNLRFQSHPAVDGFDVVVRILRTNNTERSKKLSLTTLGYTNSQIDTINLALGSAWGGVFIAGVTGSGKTTTLNAMLKKMAQVGNRKIISIEDPVEYEVEGVSHFSIQRKVDNDESENPFKGAMMAFLRMDPDIGMFGEIRDQISAEMALNAIQTGHKILTTVHATSALGVVGRLTSKSLGLLRENVCTPEFISTLVYQVLTPINCPDCKILASEVMLENQLLEYKNYFDLNINKIYCASELGCPSCRKANIDYSKSTRVGVKGVKVSAEVITPDDEIYTLLSEAKYIEARRLWRKKRITPYDNPDMMGKEAWGHALYDMSQGLIDPYYFEMNFGAPKIFKFALD